MHTIQDRPVAVDGQVLIRPMMYLALSYDHRLIDGKTAVQFLMTVKNLIEDPARICCSCEWQALTERVYVQALQCNYYR